MSSKILKNAGLLLVVTCFFLACNGGNPELNRERAISFFIMEMADDYESYQYKDFKKLDVEFLESQMAIYEQFAIVQDTTRRRLQLVDKLNLALSEEQTQFRKKQYRIDEVDEILLFNAQLDRLLDQSNMSLAEEVLNSETQALHRLNEFLGLYNLSIYSIDLSGQVKSYYYHKFKLDGKTKEGIFEIDHDSEEILSYKMLG